jgi:hypothetical protein
MKKYGFLFIFLFILALILVGVCQGAGAEDFAWYTPKERVTGGINLRQGPSLHSEVAELVILQYFYAVPLFKVVAKDPKCMFKVQSNRNGTPRNADYKYSYFWVASWLLRKVDLEKDKLAVLLPADYEYKYGINVYSQPHIFSEQSWDTVPNCWQYAYVSVEMTGRHEGPFIEIIQQYGSREGGKYFILSEFFGFKSNAPPIKYPTARTLYTRSTYLDGSRYWGRISVRKEPSLLSLETGYYACGGLSVKVIGEQGDFYNTRDGEWIFKQCLVERRGE